MSLNLKVLSQELAVVHLGAEASVPAWALASRFFSITRTDQELSVFCVADDVPDGTANERAWRAFRVEGPLDFGLTGVVSSLSFALAAKQISIFSISTYETDYILVREERLADAIAALKRAGHQFVE